MRALIFFIFYSEIIIVHLNKFEMTIAIEIHFHIVAPKTV